MKGMTEAVHFLVKVGRGWGVWRVFVWGCGVEGFGSCCGIAGADSGVSEQGCEVAGSGRGAGAAGVACSPGVREAQADRCYYQGVVRASGGEERMCVWAVGADIND